MQKHDALVEFASKLLEKTTLDDGLNYISLHAKEFIPSDRCSIFLLNKEEDALWTLLADGIERITIPYDMGIVGKTIKLKKALIDNDPYDSTHFLSDVDMQTGYYTQNLLTAPIFNSKQKVFGVIELLNKEGEFNEKDREFLRFFAHYISGYVELMNDRVTL